MPVRLCFENKKILSFSSTQEKTLQRINITFKHFKENLA